MKENENLEWWDNPEITKHFDETCYVCGKFWSRKNRKDNSLHDDCWDEEI